MPNWSGLILTQQGRQLQAKVEAGTKLAITKLKLGSGVLPEGKQMEELRDLVTPKQNVGIATIEAQNDGTCKLSATISNTGLAAGYYVRELGVFATDPDKGEILYLVANDSAPDYLPAEGGATVVSQEFAVYVSASNTDNVVAQIDAGALATMGYVQLSLKNHNDDIDAHSAAIGKHNSAASVHTANLASKAEAEAGINTSKFMTPARDREAIQAFVGGDLTGMIFAFAGNSIPSGFLLCDGSKVSRTTYKKLFNVIGTTYGAGDGSTTFTLPNLIDRFLEGSSAAGNYYSAGLPNLTGTVVDIYGNFDLGIAVNGNSFKGTRSGYRESVKNGCNEWQEQDYDGFSFNASWANTIYGSSDTVQPPALTIRYIVKY